MTAAASRPITFSANASTFLRVYDAGGQSIATDHGSGPGGTSQITLEADRGQLFYLEVSAYNGTDTGAYAVHVSQPTDDHPDAPIFALKKSQTRDASVISLDGSGFGQATGQIEATLVGDRDVFQVIATQRGQMTVSVATTDNQLDTFLRVYDSHGNLVGIDDDSGGLRNSAVTFATFQNETYQIEISGYNDNSVGAYRVTAQTSGPASIESVGTFDNFNSGFDTSKWSLLYVNAPGSANLNVSSGRVRLEAYGNGANDNTETQLISRGTVESGVTWDMAGEFGTGYNYGYASVDDGTGHSITVQMNRYSPTGDNVIVAGASGYTTLQNSAPLDTTTVTFGEGVLYTFSIREEAGEIHVYMNDTLLARYAGTIASGSRFGAHARSASGAGRYGFITLDNVTGSFAISDPLPAEIPATTTTTSGTYDDFQDNSLDSTKWTPEVYGVTTVTETSGTLQLFANGVGAATDDNVAVVTSKGIIQGDVEFDLTAHLGHDANADYVEVTDGTNHIRPVIYPDGAGGLAMIVESVGYTEIENLGPRSVIDGRTYHIAFTQTDAGVGVYCDGVRIALYAGHLQINSVLHSRVESAKSAPRYAMDLYDDFNDGSINSTKWSISQDPSGQGVAETGGKMILYATANSNARTQSVSSTSQAGGIGIHGAKWTMAYLDGGHENMNHYAEITNGTDYIRIVSDSNWQSFWIGLGGSYGSGSVNTISGPAHTIDIKEVGADIQILFDGTIRYTIVGKAIAANSYFHAFANYTGGNSGGYGNTRLSIDNVYLYHAGALPENDRFAQLTLDNVQGTFRSTTDAIRNPYDDFTDNQVDSSKWHVVGAVEETGGTLKMPLFRGGLAVAAYADTAGIAGGMNLRGFKVHIDRTVSPKSLSGWDTLARLRLTNGNDWIEVGWNLSNNSLHIETGGDYGSMVKEIAMPSGQVLDGTLEVRETNGNIEVLHDGSIQVAVIGQTVRAGSYLTIESAGNPYHQSMHSPPTDFDISLDDISFYVDPLQPNVAVTPSLKSTSDTGHSSTDHVTNLLSLDFEWTQGSPTTEYQWRQGELLGDGTIQYGSWSQEQSTTTAHVDLPHGSVHVFSVRPVDASGHIGIESSQAFVVDTTLPSSTLTFPAQGGHYNVAGWTGTISGTATDTGGAGLDKVQVSIKRNSDNKYWGGTAFDQSSEFFIDATGTGDWSVPFSAADLSSGVNYTIHSQARDLAGNAESGPMVTFAYDTTPPVVQNVLVRGSRLDHQLPQCCRPRTWVGLFDSGWQRVAIGDVAVDQHRPDHGGVQRRRSGRSS